MSLRKSLVIGGTIVIIAILLSMLTFYMSLGSCPNGSFACDNDTVCVPQRQVCDGHPHCKDNQDEDPIECGMFYGSTEMLSKVYENVMTYNKTERPSTKSCSITTFSRRECICATTMLFCIRTNKLKHLPLPVSADQVTGLYLANNTLQLIPTMFDNFSLSFLNLGSNDISEIPSEIFSKQKSLKRLYLNENNIGKLPQGLFAELIELKWLFLNANNLSEFGGGLYDALKSLQNLQCLDLADNELWLVGEEFPPMENMTELMLDRNRLELIDDKLFANLRNLHLLSLESNQIHTIHPSAFRNLLELRELRLSSNKLQHLPNHLFKPVPLLDALYLGKNNLSVTKNLLEHVNVSYLNLDGITFESIDFETVARMEKLQYIVYKKFYYCSMTRHVKKCKPHTDGVSSFNNLLEKPVLRFSAWLMALFTFFGNGLVLWGRYTFHDENRAVSLVIRNLAVADLLMGVYLFIIGAQDLRFRQTYNLHAKDWVVSWNCAITGIVALVSSEVSVFILAFMSVERFLLISDPFGGHRRLNAKNMLVCLFSIWMVGITIAVVPLILYRSSTKFYGTYSGTCFPLLLHLELGWQYSAFLFLGVNMSLLVLIAGLYTALLVSIWRTRRATPLALLDFEFAIRFFFIVLTDATCWAPIIALKILAFFHYEISGDVYAWLVIFVLPLNSAINPLLYTFTTPKYRDQFFSKEYWYRHKKSVISNPDESQGKIIPLLLANSGKFFDSRSSEKDQKDLDGGGGERKWQKTT